MKKATIYTRKGDNGTTTLASGEKVDKDCIRVEAYGTIDELNAHMGLLAAAVQHDGLRSEIDAISNNLFLVGGYLACGNADATPIPSEAIERIEAQIDALDTTLEPIRSFLLPPCTEAAARANVCRTICRRAERRIVALSKSAAVDPLIAGYVNRLSDYLFVLSRILSRGNEKFVEKHWK